MKKYVKEYFQRGLAFGGFGPIIMGIVLFVIELCGVKVSLNGTEILIAVVSTYILAFVQAGASVFNQIESWPIAKSMGIHFISIYIVYVLCYLVNNWIPFDWKVIIIFTAIFIAVYIIVWVIVYSVVKSTSKKLNKALRQNLRVSNNRCNEIVFTYYITGL